MTYLTCGIYYSPSLDGRELEGGWIWVKESQRKIVLARNLRHSQTDAEKALWARLRNKQLEGIKFRRQESLVQYIVDFVSFESKVVIKIDGGQHNERETRASDAERTAWLKQRSYRVLRFWNNDVLANMDGVLANIQEFLGKGHPHLNPLPSRERKLYCFFIRVALRKSWGWYSLAIPEF